MIAVMPVIAVFTILISLIVITPGLAIAGSLLLEGFVLAIAAIAIALIALTLHMGDAHRLTALLKPIVPVLLLPCVWMLLQIVPAGNNWLAHPAWMSASAALGKPLLGTISVDIGATLLCVARYSLLLAIGIATAATALDRQRAEIILYVLTAAAALIATALIGLNYFRATDLSVLAQRPQMTNIAAIGVILSFATVIQAYENQHMRARSRKSSGPPAFAIAFFLITFAICLLAIMTAPDATLLLAAACGSAILISVTAIRRLRLGPWGRSGIVAAAIVGLIGFFAANPIMRNVDLTLSLASPPQLSIPTAERILADARWAGTGAGTFSALSPIYSDADDADSDVAPTAAAAIAIEMGRPFLWTVVILALISAWIFFKRALARGRDYHYAGAGAGSIVAILVFSFANAGAFGLAASLFISMVCGVALAQSQSWSTLDPATSGLKIPSETHASSVDRGFRIGLLVFASLLAMQAIWISLAEYYHPYRIHLPVVPQANRIAIHEQENAKRAAALGMFRGDLWAESAFTRSDLLWGEPAATSANENARKESQMDMERALRYSPHRGDVWLMLAAMADRYNWQEYQPNALLKMSYFTAPSELSLFPLRVRASLRPNAIQDPEIQDMVRRDIRVIVTKSPALKPTLATAYRTSSAEGKAFLDRAMSEIDPVYLAVIRAGLR